MNEPIDAQRLEPAAAETANTAVLAGATPANAAPLVAAPEDATVGVGAEVLAGALGCAVAMLCLLPPILHFVTGPLGPLIGGFLASKRLPRGTRRSVVVFMIGGGVTAAVGIGALVISKLGEHGPAAGLPGADTIAFILVGVFVYAAGLAAIGAVLARIVADSGGSTDVPPGSVSE